MNVTVNGVERNQMRWFPDDTVAVIDRTRIALDRFSIDDFQRELFGDLLDEAPTLSSTEAGHCIMPIHLPLSVFQAIGRDKREAFALAIVLVLLETGIYVLDHLMDDELSETLARRPIAAVLTAATCFISYLPQMALAEIDCDEPCRARLNAALCHGLAQMGYGQLLDVSFKLEQLPTPEQIEQCVIGKTGARRALYARMAATLAGASPAEVERYAAFGEALGVARQVHSDLVDIFCAATSRDIASGACTLPLALYFADADAAGRASMLHLIEVARHDPTALTTLRTRLRMSGALRKTLVHKETFCARALHHLQMASPAAEGAAMLVASVNEISWRQHAHA
jgi:geranylgeranyl pyrophosphate synthase